MWGSVSARVRADGDGETEVGVDLPGRRRPNGHPRQHHHEDSVRRGARPPASTIAATRATCGRSLVVVDHDRRSRLAESLPDLVVGVRSAGCSAPWVEIGLHAGRVRFDRLWHGRVESLEDRRPLERVDLGGGEATQLDGGCSTTCQVTAPATRRAP